MQIDINHVNSRYYRESFDSLFETLYENKNRTNSKFITLKDAMKAISSNNIVPINLGFLVENNDNILFSYAYSCLIKRGIKFVDEVDVKNVIDFVYSLSEDASEVMLKDVEVFVDNFVDEVCEKRKGLCE